MDILLRTEQPRVLVVGIGPLAETAVAVGRRLADQGIGVTVLDPVWALPISPSLAPLAADHDLVITIEDNGVVGGYGARLAQELRLAEIATPLREFGIRSNFLIMAVGRSCSRRLASRRRRSRATRWRL
jgi:1-deoxy-D-xylulose-5-phosphate synthase